MASSPRRFFSSMKSDKHVRKPADKGVSLALPSTAHSTPRRTIGPIVVLAQQRPLHPLGDLAMQRIIHIPLRANEPLEEEDESGEEGAGAHGAEEGFRKHFFRVLAEGGGTEEDRRDGVQGSVDGEHPTMRRERASVSSRTKGRAQPAPKDSLPSIHRSPRARINPRMHHRTRRKGGSEIPLLPPARILLNQPRVPRRGPSLPYECLSRNVGVESAVAGGGEVDGQAGLGHAGGVGHPATVARGEGFGGHLREVKGSAGRRQDGDESVAYEPGVHLWRDEAWRSVEGQSMRAASLRRVEAELTI